MSDLTVTTKDIDLAGCNLHVADALKKGKAIRCECYDGTTANYETKARYVLGYAKRREFPYLTAGESYRYAEPIYTKKTIIVKSAVEIMKGLIERAYRRNEGGVWCLAGSISVKSYMWQRCGKDPGVWEFEPWMLEEIEKEVTLEK